MRSWPFLLFPFLTAAVLAGEPDRAAIHDIQQAYWNSIATMEVKGDEFVLDGSLKPKEGPQIVHQEFELLYGSGARLSFRRISKAADGGIRGSYQFREDGRAKYGIVTFAGEPDAIDEVAIQSQTDRPGHYEGEMCIAFWAWMPAGKPVHVWLDDGATLRSSTAKAGREVVTLAAQHHGRSLLIDLDPDHDWLPERVELVGSHRVQVRKFARDNNHWFPADVTFEVDEANATPNTSTRQGFLLRSLVVNGPVDPKRFGIPEITAGVYVGDQRNWSGSFKGGFAARQKLDRSRAGLAQPTPSNDADKIASPVVAGNLPHGGTWEAALVAVALATFAIAWKLHRAA